MQQLQSIFKKDTAEIDNIAIGYQKILDKEANHTRTWIALGDVNVTKYDFEGAKKAYYKATEIDPRFIDDIMSRLEKLLPIQPKDAELYLLIGQLYLRKNDYNKAGSYFAAGIKNARPHGTIALDIFLYLGYTYLLLNKPDKAYTNFQRVKELSKDINISYARIKEFTLNRNKIEEEKIRLKMKNSPNATMPILALAELLLQNGDYERIVQLLQFKSKNNTMELKRINLLGRALIADNKSEIAIKKLESYIPSNKNLSGLGQELCYTLAIAYEKCNKLEKAIGLLKRIASQDTNIKDVMKRIKRLYHNLAYQRLQRCIVLEDITHI